MELVKFFMFVEVVLAFILAIMGLARLGAKIRGGDRTHVKHPV